jgi:hypothetical protein
MINRSVLIVKAKEPFVKWLNSLPDPAEVSLEEVNEDTLAYLLPEYVSDDEQHEIIADFFESIFQTQLASWWTEEKDWPVKRDLALFTKWFEVQFHSMAVDLVDAPLESLE